MSTTLAGAAHLLRGDTAALVLANFASALAGIVTGVASARALGAGGRGDLAVVLFWPALVATIVDFGVADAVTLRIAGAPGHAKRAAVNGLLLATVAGCIGAAVGYLALPLALRADQAALLGKGRWAMAYVPLSSLASVPVAILLGLRQFKAVAAVRVATAAIYTTATIAAVVGRRADLEALMWMAIAARGAPAILSFHRVITMLSANNARLGGSPHLRDQARDGAWLHTSRLTSVLAASEDRAIASAMLTQAHIGLWQVASALLSVLQFVSQAIVQQLFATAAASPESRGQLVYASYVRAVTLTGLAAAGSAAILPFAIPLLYGAEFAEAVGGSMTVLAGAVVAAGAATLQAGARAALQSASSVASEAVGAIVMAAVAVALVPSHGGVGLATAYGAGRFAVLAVMGWTIQAGIKPGHLVPFSARFTSVLGDQIARFSSKQTGPS